ncbi:hypothetical protein [Streptomyces sp. DH37]|uniref:hypothetical protein n=1 Tax=Streptomyces sp. DH37 TaxID=3040122 RepID=UPI0024413D35|nr:hypothetical protein [Streptomyces sp. DH37]MDG9702582.1 hypothetical protein [Streptomyces sp. DH37]
MRTGSWRVLALPIAVLALAGCGLDPLGSSDRVSLTVSGGIAGVQRGIDVASDGEVRITSRKGTRSARALSDAERGTLDSLLDEVDFDELPDRVVSDRARDRFEYRLEHGGHTLVTDKSEDLGAADDLIEHLQDCLNDRL